MKLTERVIAKLSLEKGRKDRLIFDDVQRGLAVRITAGGGHTYIAQYTHYGSKYRVPLGSCAALSLHKAREAAAAVMGDVAKGRNPAVERKEAAAAARAKAARESYTLAALIEDWERVHLAHRRPRYSAEAVRALRHAFARYLDHPAEELQRANVVRTIDGLTSKNKKDAPEDAQQALRRGNAIARGTVAYGRAAFGWAMKRGTVAHNPFADLPARPRVPSRDRVLSDDELGAIWRAASETTFPYGFIVRMLILTGQRRDEVAGMAWTEVTDDLATWTIPGSRTKNGIPQIVPLSNPARDLLRKLLPDDDAEAKRALAERRTQFSLVFPGQAGTYSGWSKSKRTLDLACSVAGWWLHDLRRTLATGFQRLGVRLEVTEAVLNHISGSRAGIVGVYQRHDWAGEKRVALDSWSAHILTISEGRLQSANVAAFRPRG